MIVKKRLTVIQVLLVLIFVSVAVISENIFMIHIRLKAV